MDAMDAQYNGNVYVLDYVWTGQPLISPIAILRQVADLAGPT